MFQLCQYVKRIAPCPPGFFTVLSLLFLILCIPALHSDCSKWHGVKIHSMSQCFGPTIQGVVFTLAQKALTCVSICASFKQSDS